MSLDRSLKIASGLAKHRNVLSRAERVAKLVSTGRFDMESGDPFNLPKVANRKVVTSGKAKKQAVAADSEETPAADPAK